MGGAVAAPLATGLLTGCQTDHATVNADGWEPSVLSAEQDHVLIEASERIMPQTDTPGAKAANVNRYIDEMLKDMYTEEDQADFKAVSIS